jgi:protein O-mannosyl-transferase
MRSGGTWQIAAAALPALAAVVVYLPALRNGFVWDDPLVLQQLRAIHSVGDLLVLPPIIPKFYFRPVVFVSYLVDRWLGGETPFWFHASVIAFHGLNTLLVFGLARQLFPTAWLVASGGALLFAVFPTHVESVAWMAGRSDVLVCTFMLASVLLYTRRGEQWSSWLGGLAFFLALLSKEMALACVAIIPLLDLLSTQRLIWSRYVPLAIAVVGYFALRQHGLGMFIGGTPTAVPAGQVADDLGRAVGFYLVQAIVPVHLSAYVPDVPASALYLAVGVIGVTAGIAATAASGRAVQWQVGFLVAWFFLTLAPSLTVILRRSASAVVADRYLYVPTVASCLLVVWGILWLADRWRLPPRAALALVGALCLVFSLQVTHYSRVWTDNLTFWTDVAAKTPGDSMPQRELAAALVERQLFPEAEAALQRALAGKSDREGLAMTYNNLGILYRRLERYDDAEQAFHKGLAIAPHPMLYHNLGMALMKRIEAASRRGDQAAVLRDLTQARQAFEAAIRLGNAPGASTAFAEWSAAKSHALLGQILLSLGDRAGAQQELETALRLEPSGPVADATRQYMKRLQ